MINALRNGMKTLITILLLSSQVEASDYSNVMSLAQKNGYKPSKQVVMAVVKAAHFYGLDPLDLAAIGLIETGLGRFNQDVHNRNGTVDTGIFQINTINRSKCSQFDLNTPEGSAFCAAKLLSKIKRHYALKDPQWPAIYHSKTKSHKDDYFRKIAQVLDREEN